MSTHVRSSIYIELCYCDTDTLTKGHFSRTKNLFETRNYVYETLCP